MTKITADHLGRGAFVYIRQSTADQLLRNLESRRRQYGLADRARQLGWTTVEVIDDDLGRSGGGIKRPGFERLLAAICEGRVGAVFAIEASRLARNGRDWHTLIEFCGLVGTVIVDEDGIYDPRHPNDRLLLGMKGTMSELELSLFPQRSSGARVAARRGHCVARRTPYGGGGAQHRLEAAALQHRPQHPDQSRLCWCLCFWPHDEPGGRRERSQARQARFAAPAVGMGCAAQGSARRLYHLERVREEPARDYQQRDRQRLRSHWSSTARRTALGWTSALWSLRPQAVRRLWRQGGALLLPGRARESWHCPVHLIRRFARR